MKKQLVALGAAALMAWSVPTLARDFQAEVGGSYIYFDPKAGDSDYTLGADVRYFFNTVQTEGRPLAEAAFIGRNSNAFAAVTHTDEADDASFNVGTEWYVGRFYARAEVDRITTNGSRSTDGEIAIGFVPVDGLLFQAGYGKIRKTDIDRAFLGAKWVTLFGSSQALNLEARFDSIDDGLSTKTAEAAVDFYFNRRLSIGGRYNYVDNDLGNESAYGGGFRAFITPLLSLEGEYLRDEDKNNVYGLRLAARF